MTYIPRLGGLVLIMVALSPNFGAGSGDAHTAALQPADEAACVVTTPNRNGRGGNYGSEALRTTMTAHVGFIPGGPGCVEPDGYLGMKWPWWRSVNGPLAIEGRRLDGSARPLRANIPNGYGDTGFQSSGLLFDGPGCWEVTGRVGDASITFVTLVTMTGGGPATRCRQIFGGFEP